MVYTPTFPNFDHFFKIFDKVLKAFFLNNATQVDYLIFSLIFHIQ